MAGDLIIPRVKVTWAGEDLTAYQLDGSSQKAPIVYNITCQLQEGNSNPTGTMEWEPTGPAFAAYEKFLKDKLREKIIVTFYYLGGRELPLHFVWAGNSITYGTDMKITVDLKSELDGTVNAIPKSTSTANKDEKSIAKLDQSSVLTKQYGVDPKLIRYSKTAEKDMKTATIKNMHTQSQTFAEAANSLISSNGNVLFPNNIDGPNMTANTPWTYKGEAKTVVEEPKLGKIDPTVRYGFLLGPSMFSTIERKAQWKPPQQTNTNSVGGNAKPTPKQEKNSKPKPTTPAGNVKVQEAAAKGTAAPGASQGRLNKNLRNDKDEVGTAKQRLTQDENGSTLSVSTFMVPALTGVKPADILYVPSLGSAKTLFMEDWVVRSVTYTQTDGGVMLSIEGSRWFGNSELMQKDPAKPWVEKAKSYNADPTLGKWQEYAWTLQGQPAG